MADPGPNWGVELWDQYDKISSHTQNGVQFLENFHSFIKERALIETEYADKLRKMARKYQYQPKKVRCEDEDASFTTNQAFNSMLNEVVDLAGQHEVISEELMAKIAKEIASLVRELKDERKRLLAEGTKLQTNLQNSVAQMEKCQRAYVKAHREAEKACEKFERADKDMHLSRAEVEIAKQASIAKNQFCEDAKAEYAAQLQKTNDLQRMHFNDFMPRVFTDLQQMDERRISCIQNFMKQVASIQLHVIPIVNNCLNGIISAAETIDPIKDSETVVEKYKSGFFPPDDFPFENLNEEKPNGASLTYSTKEKLTIRGTMSGKSKKRSLLAGIFGPSNKNNLDDAKEDTWADLPPNQRRKKISKKLKEISDELVHETSQKDALHRMKRTYEENPAMGDPNALDGELSRSALRIDSLHQQRQKYQGLLSEIESSTPDAVKRHSGHQRGNSIISEDTGSLSRSNSDESNIHNSGGRLVASNSGGISRNTSSSSTNSYHQQPSTTPTSPSNPNPTTITTTTVTTTATNGPVPNGHHGNTNGGVSVPLTAPRVSNVSNGHHITPIEEEGGGSHQGGFGQNGDTTGGGGAYNSESGVGSGSLRDIDDGDFEDGGTGEEETLAPLGTAIALYAFDAQSEGSIAMNEQEEMHIVELDRGDGWTRVRLRGGEEGFVPTSYLEVSMYNTC